MSEPTCGPSEQIDTRGDDTRIAACAVGLELVMEVRAWRGLLPMPVLSSLVARLNPMIRRYCEGQPHATPLTECQSWVTNSSLGCSM